jgi:23S rRNA (uracil1939-C5)-methyltransferase
VVDVARKLTIERLGARGDGIAASEQGAIFVPYALAGETVLAEVDGERGHLAAVLQSSPDRVDAICPYYSICGGCAVQTLRFDAYAAWKRNVVATALKNAGIRAAVAALVDCHGAGRRRVTLHARSAGRLVRVGFMRARSHDLIDITCCPLLAPALQHGPTVARALAQALRVLDKPLDIHITAAVNGLDIELRGCGPLPAPEIERLVGLAALHDLARLTNHGEMVALRRQPIVTMGLATVILPAGGFLQATEAAETEIARRVENIVVGARRIADLYCGVGTFALRLAERAEVSAFDSDPIALAALSAAHRATPPLRSVTTHLRDLGRRPLLASDLKDFDALVIDPPRIGAETQVREIARSEVPIVAAVSCNAATFARDAGILIGGGFALHSVTPLDQFRFSPHVEIIGHFVRPSRRPRRRLLG